ncbi:DUF2695 domain-containing protein [Ktedonospora formicarum]|uniref:DUF2695 domain-containing protein n=1 Tax=Ktedonospora formicarum TaxID=2778364 RepID=A0A8J3I9J0_9CHLR|nr:DUF2695 domain-containing protein [Ktedonospora formicarum]GHO48487.1 hypothetical protein KSX_66500 [Ktedonospora formicarum]
MSNKVPPFLSQATFDVLFTWLQERCKERHTLSGVHYTCAHTFEHTQRWLEQNGLEADAYLAHLRAHHISCDCAILQRLTDWP